MQNSAAVRVLNCPSHFGHQRHCASRFPAQGGGGLEQAAAACKLHAEVGQTVVRFADLVDGQDVGVIEAGGGLRFATESRQRFLRIGVVREDSFQRNDAPGMSLSRPVNDAHPAAPDLFQNLIVPDVPIGIEHADFAEHVIQRFIRAIAVSISADALCEETTQAKTTANARHRSTLGTEGRFLFAIAKARQGYGNRSHERP